MLCRHAAFFGHSFLDIYEETESIGKAVHVFKEALEIYTFEAYPIQYAETQKYIGIAYKKYADYQDIAPNKEAAPDEEAVNEAIFAFEESLKVYTAEKYPIQYAFVQKNRGIVYKKLARARDREENLNSAGRAFKEALKVYTMRDFPHDCAECLKELAYVYKKLAGFRDREENLRRVIHVFKGVLRVYTAEKYPSRYGMTQNNMGITYSELADFRDKKENLNRALRAFKESAGIKYASMFGTNCVQSVIVRYNLCEVYRRLAEVTHTAENLKLSLHACRDGVTFCI